MTDSLYWVWLQEALGIGNIKVDRVVREIGSPEAFYRMDEDALRRTGFLARKEIERVRATGLDGAKRSLERAAQLGFQAVTPDHPDFPSNLANIDCMPCVLYVQGSLAGLDRELVFAMVGSRKSTDYGMVSAEKLGYDLADRGCVVASGLADGIDTACHTGALNAGGRCIGLLACGLDVDYPRVSRALKERILGAGGALISEFPFGTSAYRYNFNIRNRLLSGIAEGTIVVQAPEQSGSLNTARHALDQNRDVFAVPGGIFDPAMAGCNRLIRDGAKIVVSVYSILEEYIGRFPERIDPGLIYRRTEGVSPKRAARGGAPRRASRAEPPAEDDPGFLPFVAQEPREPLRKPDEQGPRAPELSEPARRLLALLDGEPRDCDWLIAQGGLSTPAAMAALTELELCGLADSLPGRRYAAHRGGRQGGPVGSTGKEW